MTLPAPGLHPRVPRDEYHRWDAVGSTVLKLIERRSPAHAREEELHPKPPTKALTLGDALHARVLEPTRWAAEYAIVPPLDRRRAADKRAWERFETENPGRTLLKEAEGELIEGMRDSVLRKGTALRQVLEGKHLVECSALWAEPIGVHGKLRIDLYGSIGDFPVLVDLKSTKDASPRGWPREAARYGYHIQAAWYLRGLDRLAPKVPRRFLFVAVENYPPFASAEYELDLATLQLGARAADRALRAYAESRGSGTWGAYPWGVQPLSFPEWMFHVEPRDEEDEE